MFQTWHAFVNGALATLFERAHPKTDPEGLITKFVEYECFRIHRNAYDSDIKGSLQARLRVLFWYLDDYNRQRQYRYSLPLSRQQIAYLNGPMPVAGASDAVTVALFNFVMKDRAGGQNVGFRDFADPAFLQRSVYWWCVDKAPLLRVEQSLVTAAHVDILRDHRGWTGTDFPLNVFMSRFLESNSAFDGLDMAQPRNRAALYCYLLLYAFTRPSIIRFLPAEWIKEALLEKIGGPSFFENVLARYAVADSPDHLSDAATLKAMGLALIAQAGIPLRPVRANGAETVDVGECLIANDAMTTPVEPGVAVIGPLLKTSGLGQAARLSLEMLTRVEAQKPTALIFDLENPAPVDTAFRRTFEPYRNRRSINIIHLNAEMIPLCFAFKPKSFFSDSYNIGYFFWELNEIPNCQRLALDLLDEIWVASEFNREIYARSTRKPVVNVGMALHRLPDVAPTDREMLGIARDAIVFLSTFDSFSFIERKNPLGIIAAFSAAFPTGQENVILILKTQNKTRVSDTYQIDMWTTIETLVRTDRRIVLLDGTYSYKEIIALMKASDCYVSLHRSEGFGFGLVEAMQLQMPVICTAYSGNLEYCNDTTAYMVGYSLIPVQREEYIYVPRGSVWADPDIGSAADHMKHVVADRASCTAKGQAAARFVADYFDIGAGAKRYQARLSEIRKTL